MLTGSEGLAVGVDDPPAASDADSLRRLAAASMSDLPEATGVESVDDVMIDGERAVGARASYVGGENEPYGITAYAVVHDGRLFTLSYSSRGAVDEQQVATFDAILDGWRWT